MTQTGAIYLIGTGPGSPGLITVKGLALLRGADAIVANTLNLATLLQEANPQARRYDIGGCRRGNRRPAAEIIKLLLELAQQGQTVVRLWEGDPFVYGQAAQELAAAIQANIHVEVVPGVTSITAALAYAGVPVTHWDYSASFGVTSGFIPADSSVDHNWSALAALETLVIVMPTENLPEITARLQEAGRASSTPVLIIQNGTLPHQKLVQTRLDRLVAAAEQHRIAPPAILVIGQLVNLTDQLAWFRPGDHFPLLGKRVLVTRPVHQAADFMAALRKLGAEPISFPTIEICPAKDPAPLDRAIRQFSGRAAAANKPTAEIDQKKRPYDWLVLTSTNGVAAFWNQLNQAGLDSRCLAGLKIAAIGPVTANALSQRSIKPDLVPEQYTAEGVLAAFDQLGPIRGQRFLLARADIARKTLARGLVDRGAIVDEVAAYRTIPRQTGPTPPPADIVTFTSSSTVQGYVNCLAGRLPSEALQNSKIICIGPITAATAAELGVPVSAVAEEYTIQGLLKTLETE